MTLTVNLRYPSRMELHSWVSVLSLLLNIYFNNRFDHSDNQVLNATLSQNIRGLVTSETFTSKQITSIFNFLYYTVSNNYFNRNL